MSKFPFAFFVYETGFLEIVTRNLTDIAGEDIFKVLLKWVLKYAVAKLRLPVGAKGIEAVQPTDIELHEELSKREEGQEPFAGEPVIRGVEPVTELEEQELREDLAQDSDLMETIEAIGKSGESEVEADAGTRGPGTGTQKSAQTLMSPDVVAEINKDVADAESGGSRGVLTTATVLYRAGKVLVRTIDRFRHHRDHGVYPTVVEEILREFYIANIGTSKQEMSVCQGHKFRIYNEGFRTWQLDLVTGQKCILLTTEADLRKPETKMQVCN